MGYVEEKMDKVIIWWVSRDWLLTMQFVKDLSTIFATITAGIVAILGLRTWKIQLKGRTEYDLAKKLLVEIYKIKESLLFVRSFYMSGGERANAYEKLKLDLEKEDPGYDGKILRSVYFIRMKGLNENHNNLHKRRIPFFWCHFIVHYQIIKSIITRFHTNNMDGKFRNICNNFFF